jgi:fucose 4-O-acetylase-like acetyltransferase
MNKSIEWVYSIKVFGIIAVILGHIANPFGDFIFSWHMPLFFMISGFFIKTEANIKDLIIKDWKRLMIPYFIFSALALAITSLKIWGLQREPLNYLYELNAIAYWMDYKHLINTYAFVLWFLPTLFFAKIFYYTIKKYISSLLLQTSLFLFLFMISFQVPLPFALSNAMNSVLWIFIGSVLFGILNSENKVHLSQYSHTITLLLPAVVIVIIYAYWGIPKLDMSSLKYANKILNVLWVVSLFMLFTHLCKALTSKAKKEGLLVQWAGGTMMLFILHPYTNNISHIIVEKLHFGGWPLKLTISLILLQLLLIIKQRFSNQWIFKYV